jgi:DNA-directed RNA polymerase specialized sigma24 family protein
MRRGPGPALRVRRTKTRRTRSSWRRLAISSQSRHSEWTVWTGSAPDAAAQAETADSLSMAFLVLLESLTPVERAVFLLREVFDYDYAEITKIVQRSEDNCRQLYVRARRDIDQG